MTRAVLEPSALGAEEPASSPEAQPRRETTLRLAALVVGTLLFGGAIFALGGWPWVVVVALLILIVMLHELGHFVTAKRSGMKATEFFVGFGPRLWSIRRGETEYGFKALPLGGYVKILGMTSAEELDPSDEPRSFVNQSTSKRVLVASAGSIVHLLIAIALAIGALWFIGSPLREHVRISSLTHVTGVVTPAQRAGLHRGDELVSVNGVKVYADNAIDTIRASANKAVTVVVLRAGKQVTVVATPQVLPGAGSSPKLGIELVGTKQQFSHPGLLGSVTGGAALTWHVTTGTGAAFVHAFSPAGLGSLANQVASPQAAANARASGQSTVSMIGALRLLVDATVAGPLQLMGILIALNISFAVLNMLPMLPLDGGHVAIALYERARTRKGRPRYRADVRKLMPVVVAFMAFLLVFVAGKMYLDIAHGTANPFG